MNIAFLNVLPDLVLRGLGIYDRVQSDVQKRAAAQEMKKVKSAEDTARDATAADRKAIN